ADAGSVNALYGSARGLSAKSNQFWTQDSPGIADHAEADDTFGRDLAAGDYDGDGHADLAVAAPWEGRNGLSQVGAVHVLYGSAAGLSATGSQFWTRNAVEGPGAASTGDWFGRALSAADFNGDKVTDLAVG